MSEGELVITAVVSNHTTTTTVPPPFLPPAPNYTMIDTHLITWVLMGLGCLVLSLCVILACILIYQHCR